MCIFQVKVGADTTIRNHQGNVPLFEAAAKNKMEALKVRFFSSTLIKEKLVFLRDRSLGDIYTFTMAHCSLPITAWHFLL